MAHNRPITIAAIAILIATTGCESQDTRLAEFAEHAIDQQARQNEEVAQQSEQVVRQSGELAQAAHQLVEQDATARRELIAAQSEFHARVDRERRDLNTQRRELNDQQRAAASAVVREPVIVQAILTAAFLFAALLPLLVTCYALSRLPVGAADDGPVLVDALIHELSAGRDNDGHTNALPQTAPALLDGRAPNSDGASQQP
jgi:hypothetical protein